MLALLSPAKDMKVLPSVGKFNTYTLPDSLGKSASLIMDLKRMKPKELAALMDISDKLALLNYDRYRNWNKNHTLDNSALAILSFTGEAYRGLRAAEFDADGLEYSQSVLRILSGLYGVVRPLDLIQEYRLEMGTRHNFRGKKNLYGFWQTTITKTIDQAIADSPGDKVLVNVASSEYFSSIDTKKLSHPIITPSFYQEENGTLKMVAVYAKRARGMMARFIIENRLEKVGDLKAFTEDGYSFDNHNSTENKWAFTR